MPSKTEALHIWLHSDCEKGFDSGIFDPFLGIVYSLDKGRHGFPRSGSDCAKRIGGGFSRVWVFALK